MKRFFFEPHRSDFLLCAAVFLFYSGQASAIIHLSRWMKFDLGMSESLLSLIICSGFLLSFLTLPAWGFIADRVKKRRSVLRVALIGSSVILLAIGWRGAMMPVAALWLLIALNMVCLDAGIALTNSIILRHVEQSKFENFARFRVLGSIGAFLATFVFSSLLLTVWNLPRASIFVFAGVSMFLALAFTGWKPPPNVRREHPSLHDAAQLLRHRNLMWFFLVSALTYFSVGGTGVFVGPYFELLGASERTFTISTGLGIGTEATVVLLLPRLLQGVKIKTLVVLISAFEVVRFTILSIFGIPWVLAAIWSVFGIGIASHFVLLPMFVGLMAPPNLRSTVQSILGALRGLGMISGILASRALVEFFGQVDLLVGYRSIFVRNVLGMLLALIVLLWKVRQPSGLKVLGAMPPESPMIQSPAVTLRR